MTPDEHLKIDIDEMLAGEETAKCCECGGTRVKLNCDGESEECTGCVF